MRLPPPGMAVVPAELMAQVQRQWIWFVALAGLALLLAVSSIVGWGLYIKEARRPQTSPQELSDALQKADSLEKRVADLESNLAEANQARLTAEARLAGTGDRLAADEDRLARAERARADAEAKLAGSEQSKSELATKLEAETKARAEVESRLAGADAARVEAEARLAELQKSFDRLQAQADQWKADIDTYRQEARAAAEGERRAAQRLREVLEGKATDGAAMQVLAQPQNQASAGTREAEAASADSTPALAGANTSGASAAGTVASGSSGPATRPAQLEEGTKVAAVIGCDPNAAYRTGDPEELSPATEALPHTELLAMGEAMIVAAHPERAVALIRKALEKGRGEAEGNGQLAAYQKSLGWALLRAGRTAEAKTALEAALTGFEDWSASSEKATPDHWTAAFLLGRVKAEDYIRRWTRDDKYGVRLACLPWFYVGQRREIEGDSIEALNAYRVCVELGQSPGSYPIWRWGEQRLRALEQSPTTQPGR